MMGFGGIFIILLTAVIVWAVIRLTHHEPPFQIGENSGSGGKDAIDILRERYARGEINPEQYEEMKESLS